MSKISEEVGKKISMQGMYFRHNYLEIQEKYELLITLNIIKCINTTKILCVHLSLKSLYKISIFLVQYYYIHLRFKYFLFNIITSILYVHYYTTLYTISVFFVQYYSCILILFQYFLFNVIV